MDENNEMVSFQTTSKFQFSGTGLDDLGASEYTLATIAVDISGSVYGWEDKLEECLSAIVKSCENSPRSENLLIRLISFNTQIDEIHGFKLLEEINANADYKGKLSPYGATSLYDAAQNAIESTGNYAEFLVDQGDMTANAIMYIVTDGLDNSSKRTPNTIRESINKVRTDELLESVSTILIGVGDDSSIADALNNFKDTAELDQFIDLTDLFNKNSPDKALAKLAGFISKSISTTSQSLAEGESAPLTF